jgi:Putative beta-barrel porin-2, OmpL-like. bbp2
MTNNSTYWYQINSALRYRLKQNYSLAMRAEYFNDPSGLILQSKLNSAEIFGLALNLSKSFNHALLRLEGNYLCDLGGRKLFASGNQTNSIAQKYIVRLNWTTFF